MTEGLEGKLVWHRSRACEGGQCAEVAATDDAVMIRNSVNPGGSLVTLSHAQWQRFLAAVKEGAFDRLQRAATSQQGEASRHEARRYGSVNLYNSVLLDLNEDSDIYPIVL
jgi:hypothetical protein